MSLDVTLREPEGKKKKKTPGIFIRVEGQMKEITRKEWDELYPGREPVIFTGENMTDELYTANITHNMTEMASKAGLYGALWRPDENAWTVAKDLIPTLKNGLAKLKAKPDYFKQFNPENGWGSYELLVEFVENYLKACKKYPKAVIGISR